MVNEKWENDILLRMQEDVSFELPLLQPYGPYSVGGGSEFFFPQLNGGLCKEGMVAYPRGCMG